ncbi:hypothetical protein JYB87_02165 [Shewanella avicenniae]|uniref:Uncharacterized protein n=1 Tax=Shewanella avicenniae TaxID=2814294 RepID=A0ABX7QTS1_9GAMM|nr:DUF5695 domain-containing protein [Shewanella avicenniae]QSX34071.1 hypothetical protein JYB87_02165 [Shewanella avicenniae]
MPRMSVFAQFQQVKHQWLLCLSGCLPWLFVAATHAAEALPDLALQFDTVSQTLVSMRPTSVKDSFDFLPSAHTNTRQGDGYYQLGDIDIRLRLKGADRWHDFSTALQYKQINTLVATGNTLASAEISGDLPGIPLRVQRDWINHQGQLVLKFTLRNPTNDTIEIGGLGLAMVFDNILSGRELDEAHQRASYAEPYMGLDAGYLQVVRLNGQGPALLVLPQQNAQFENWMPLLDRTESNGRPLIYNDPTKRTHTFEGFYDWMVFSKGFADTEWLHAEQWNTPQSLMLAPGDSYITSVKFVLTPKVRQLESTLVANQRPVAVGVPGYVVPTDLPADLFLNAASGVHSITVTPKESLAVFPAVSKGDWRHFKVQGKAWGRARINIYYDDGQQQTLHYFVTDPMRTAVDKLGEFSFTQQWVDDPNDPFKRSPAILGYDKAAGSVVTQDQRVWLAGLSDEAGAGPWLAAIMKQLGAADAEQVAKFEQFYTQVVDGRLQYNSGDKQYGVVKSLFYYAPKSLPDFSYDPKRDWSTWASWNAQQAASPERSYNYPHVAAAQWVLYRLARFKQGLVNAHDWRWYLEHAYHTSMAMVQLAPDYAQFGQMEGDVFVAILQDLKAEGMNAEAKKLTQAMSKRAEHWASLAYPFGSEMPWDSTGQEEVYAWMRYFGKTAQATKTRDVILGYDFTVPHWGYNGSARRFWDFLYAGKLSRIERQLHHYGSTINALPLLDSYRRDPRDLYLLRVAYGGMMGAMTNIDQQGFASAAFHSFPDSRKFDDYSGDYGTNFFGYAFGSSSYLVNDAKFGWLGFGGTVTQDEEQITLLPKDAFRNRIYIAPAKLWLTLDAGEFISASYSAKTGQIELTLAEATAHTPKAMLKIASFGKPYRLTSPNKPFVGRHAITLKPHPMTVELMPK